jgi:hypothetical protein
LTDEGPNELPSQLGMQRKSNQPTTAHSEPPPTMSTSLLVCDPPLRQSVGSASTESSNLFAPISIPKPVKAAVRKVLDIITKIKEETAQIAVQLILPEEFDSKNEEEVSQMRMRLRTASTHVESAGRSLKLICCEEREVLDRKAMVINQLREMDVHISVLGASLPPLPPDQRPIIFDAGTFS